MVEISLPMLVIGYLNLIGLDLMQSYLKSILLVEPHLIKLVLMDGLRLLQQKLFKPQRTYQLMRLI